MENKAVFYKHCVANTISQNWRGKESYLKKNMKLKKAGLKRLKI